VSDYRPNVLGTNVTPAKRCPFPDCQQPADSEGFCCWAHWRNLSAEDRLAVWDAFHRHKDGSMTAEELRRIHGEVVVRTVTASRNLFE